MRLIDADELEKTGIPFATHGGATFIALGSVRTAPTIEAAPVRHGRWVQLCAGSTQTECNQCGWLPTDGKTNYCPTAERRWPVTAMTALEYMEKQVQKHKRNLERESAIGVPADMMYNILMKIHYYEAAVAALKETGHDTQR